MECSRTRPSSPVTPVTKPARDAGICGDAVLTIALAASPDGPYVLPSKATLTDRSYPLTRSVYICLNRPTGTDVPPKVKDFIEFVLSAEGQEIVRQNGAYYPIPAAMVVKERGKLDDLPH